MQYAIIEANGTQIYVEENKFYDFNHINGEPGDIIKLNRILLLKVDDNINIGHPCIKEHYIEAKILKHLKSKKITVFKMKSKKNTKSKYGHRQKLTRLLIQNIIY